MRSQKELGKIKIMIIELFPKIIFFLRSLSPMQLCHQNLLVPLRFWKSPEILLPYNGLPLRMMEVYLLNPISLKSEMSCALHGAVLIKCLLTSLHTVSKISMRAVNITSESLLRIKLAKANLWKWTVL